MRLSVQQAAGGKEPFERGNGMNRDMDIQRETRSSSHNRIYYSVFAESGCAVASHSHCVSIPGAQDNELAPVLAEAPGGNSNGPRGSHCQTARTSHPGSDCEPLTGLISRRK